MRNLTVNGERLWASLMELAQIGATAKGGVCRLAASDLDAEARRLFIRWCEEAGCTVSVDRIGNIFARRPGPQPGAAAGRHRQPSRHPADRRQVRRRLWRDGRPRSRAHAQRPRLRDRGADRDRRLDQRGGFALLAGDGRVGRVHRRVRAGERAGDPRQQRAGADARLGACSASASPGEAPVGEHPVAAYFEAHIEQGPILEAAGLPIGIVTGAQGQRWYEITVTGQEAHAGPTPMPRRRDALVGAARMIDAVNRIGHAHAPYACATVGFVQVSPNSRNTIPGRVFFTVDFRHPDNDVLTAMDTGAARRLRRGRGDAAARRRGQGILVLPADTRSTRAWSARCARRPRRRALPHQDIVSGAATIAAAASRAAATAMIFVPLRRRHQPQRGRRRQPGRPHRRLRVLLNAMLDRADSPR